ncbi:AraC family transcriptional regulator [Rubinisphaera margarita]|uniref:AraC family transcriptional regulator n=1 Tax=Rubinisphaera margarita TaxID=2909586 RepID=UPI001EE95CBE|nr:helix-turn-helix domain-containing protein [Rubinisphaera margarita]MCG6157518.1 helix-turn-helix domain-containing protein [Rubinisphaera margarita]
MENQSRGFSLETFEPQLLFEAVTGTGFEHRLLRGGEFHGKIAHLQLPHCRIDQGNYNLPCFARGAFPEGWIVIGFTSCRDQPSWGNGSEIRFHQVQLCSEGLAFDYRSSPNSPWHAIQVRRDWLQEQAVAISGREVTIPSQGFANLTIPPAFSELLRDEIDLLLSADEYEPEFPTSPFAAEAEARLIRTVINAIQGVSLVEAMRNETLLEKHAIVARIESFLAEQITDATPVQELLQETGLSETSLQRFCREVYGLPPVQLFGVTRMSIIRQELLAQKPSKTSVRKLLEKWGINHSRRFASQYREFFGETPRETLTRVRD